MLGANPNCAIINQGGDIISADLIIIKKVHDGYIIHITCRQEHSHYKHKNGAVMLKKLLIKGIRPNKEYFLIAAQRILSDDEFASLKSNIKQRYVNRCRYV